ncbi:MAG: hypothetical protein AAGC84_02205 [Pseudomonas sp.]
MRVPFAVSLALLSSLAFAEPSKPAAFDHVFELAGIRLICEQSGPLIRQNLPEAQQKKVDTLFSADALCSALAKRLAPELSAEQVDQVAKVLESPLAQRFTVAERGVAEADGGKGLASYREQLASKPPRGDRVALVQRLDKAAHTTELATLLRYEVGKTQALMTLRAKGQTLSEEKLSSATAKQVEPLRESSAKAVESFMLYAYRQMPTGELTDYAALYEQEPVNRLLSAALKELPAVFAERRAALK